MPDDLFSPSETLGPALAQLVYVGSPIADRGEIMSLTDMWTGTADMLTCFMVSPG